MGELLILFLYHVDLVFTLSEYRNISFILDIECPFYRRDKTFDVDGYFFLESTYFRVPIYNITVPKYAAISFLSFFKACNTLI